MKKVFISRKQHANSHFKKQLEKNGFEVIGKSLVVISAQPVSTIPESDWVFFYSKNGVDHYFKAITKLKVKPNKSLQFACLGGGTANAMDSWKVRPRFVGNGQAETTAKAFLEFARGQKVLFPQAAQSRQSIQKLLASHLEPIPLVVYRNELLKDFELPSCDVLVFTSPLNAKAYFGRYTFNKEQELIAIGQTTGKYLTKLGFKAPIIAKVPSEAGLAAAVLAININKK